MERQILINQLEWLDNPDEFPDNYMWRRRGRLKSIVLVKGPADQYADDELEALVAFSDRQTADYDRLWKTTKPADQVKARDGCNAIIIGKALDGNWLRQRLSWYSGEMFSPSLAEAMEVFDKNLKATP